MSGSAHGWYLRARFPGVCIVCGDPYAKGEMIAWSRGKGSKHEACAKQVATPATPPTEAEAKELVDALRDAHGEQADPEGDLRRKEIGR